MQNSLIISFAEGSITEEEFLILFEEYESEGYKLKLATTLVKTLGTLTQWLVTLSHLPSPLPPWCNVGIMHSSFTSTQSTLLGGEGASRNSPL